MPSINVIKNALISVSDKTHVLNISKILIKNKINLFSTGGTAKILKENNIPVMEISEYTKFPEIMDGRVKTLHPKIMAGILRREDEDNEIMKLYQISCIDIVIVNFYPFEKVQNIKNNNIDNIINNIDIGGPTLVRASAKNYKNVIVIVDFYDFQSTIDSINNNTMNIEKRFYLATKAFEYTAYYEKIISQYFIKKNMLNKIYCENLFPQEINFSFIKKQDLRYGENQHQKASFYIDKNIIESGTISSAQQIQGKTLSYNNVSDANTALECVKEFNKPACVIVKHENPCGVAVSNTLSESYLSAYYADPVSAFGGIVAFNVKLDKKTAENIINTKQFIEVIIAPEIDILALKILKQKLNIRILVTGKIKKNKIRIDFKRITNGLLVQEYDSQNIDIKTWNFVTKRIPTKKELEDSIFCWKVAKFVKSNAIVYGRNQTTISIGAGQMSRIYSTKLANIKVKDQKQKIIGATMASDAFFPFRDGIDSAASIGINCIIQPGGSIRDKEIIQAANENNMTMIFTNKRHFKH
ncbi:MAG: bifunctional phosphoribosylaminoimidazolecarboxamide formyltransferase/IMP cyclohydrolase [Buchnera aphidicola (Brevicoryne brassicae)]|uniref:Bifunctional purine biosynthesis protein PurH n=1 Tax=Buchnera aphidicola (Brevicoryne brassicae) TaxID=911343 RepID=A0AAJ5PUN8_9GAMM|nr:bifunctional phosphoribosylaminoimidazolecarboxamide formyltransferase/IMP cyclohydrolase [Buchnera aphidicola]QCI19620.1 bifunctional phosphoribosylaminoimidazolecarboxamide formyltransferase/IMP cyclohydrolase [Buchnera aphidicola (Brevicoryne brassicae)]WAI18991.1 MAG: bifunctional phosphoribosylaminoimidazolecarboxamide formyltransferase/IMP cyclohydrolase [Buchnera aphidicola (Brevicoryne brassicae)]